MPEGALVLNVYSRIAPLPAGLDELRRRRNGQLGRDHLWLLKSDAAEVLSRLKQAKEADAPEALSRRLCRYHLTDNVRGESDLWEPENVRKRTFTMSTLAETQTSVTVRLVGAFAMLISGIKVEGRNKRSEMGLEGTLEGVLEIDKAKGTFTGAKLYASATGWGASTFTPDEPPGRFPVKFAMVVASDAVSREVAPQGVMHSGRDEYTAPK